MAAAFFSETLTPYTGVIENTTLAATLAELSKMAGIDALPLLQWDDKKIAVPFGINVEIPPLGVDGNIDILPVERLLMVFSLKAYPLTAPWVCPDRLSFPSKQLGHMYVSAKGRPGGFCLVRGEMNDWYAEKRPQDLITRIGNWFRDAVTGELNIDGQQFEPLRLLEYSGTIIYDYDKLYAIVNEKKSFQEGSNFAIALIERYDEEESTVFKVVKMLTQESLLEIFKEYRAEIKKDDTDKTKRNLYFGYVVWANENDTYPDYINELPENWQDLVAYAQKYGIDTTALESYLAVDDLNVFIKTPVILAIRRPKKIIGFSGDIEFINYFIMLKTEDVAEGKIINNVTAGYMKHSQPLTIKKAAEISGQEIKLGLFTLIAGCGALGSKVVMHLARNGMVNMILTDPDTLSPHNLVRHVAFADGEGRNKAVYLKEQIKKIFPQDETTLSYGIARKGDYMLDEEISAAYGSILDFTASRSFMNFLVAQSFKKHKNIVRGLISDFGDLGILFREGHMRNPRLDDLQVSLYDSCFENKFVAQWLKREADTSKAAIDITVGVGCNSETIILSDDVVSLHASVMSGILKNFSPEDAMPEQPGEIYLNAITRKPFFQNSVSNISVPPFEIMQAVNDPTWQVRLAARISDKMLLQLTNAYPKETGGLFIGVANYKTRTVHVTRLMDAPPDSRANEVCFFRGITGLKKSLDTVTGLSGGQLGYIGEWHTHPNGPNCMSTTDAGTVARFKAEFDELPSPLPVFLMIVTIDGLYPYVF
jgi:hypothetical protein